MDGVLNDLAAASRRPPSRSSSRPCATAANATIRREGRLRPEGSMHSRETPARSPEPGDCAGAREHSFVGRVDDPTDEASRQTGRTITLVSTGVRS